MTDSWWVVAFVTLLILLGAVVPVAGSGADRSDEATNSSNASVSTFIHSSSTDAERTVESELFDVAVEHASDDDRADIVADRTANLEDQLDALETERDTLAESNLSTPERQARTTQLSTELASLERSIDRVETRSDEADVDEQRLEALRSNASELDGTDLTRTPSGEEAAMNKTPVREPTNSTADGVAAKADDRGY